MTCEVQGGFWGVFLKMSNVSWTLADVLATHPYKVMHVPPFAFEALKLLLPEESWMCACGQTGVEPQSQGQPRALA